MRRAAAECSRERRKPRPGPLGQLRIGGVDLHGAGEIERGVLHRVEHRVPAFSDALGGAGLGFAEGVDLLGFGLEPRHAGKCKTGLGAREIDSPGGIRCSGLWCGREGELV